MNIDRRIANAVKRLHAHIDEAAAIEVRILRAEVAQAHNELHRSFNTAARSVGQSRRWGNHARSV